MPPYRRPDVALSLCILLALGALPAACGDPSARDGGRVAVAVSLPPQAFLAERIGGDRLAVVTLVSAGESPATYQPSERQVTQVLRARAFFRVGVPFERGKWLSLIEEAGQTRIVDLRAGIDLRHLEHHHHDGHDCEGEDPHIWLSPRLLAVQARTMAEALVKLDPEHAETYRENLSKLQAELRALDGELAELLKPLTRRRLYVFHPAWGYFCDAYDLEQVAVEREGKEPSEREITELVEQAREDGLTVLFVQPQITGRTAAALANTVGARVETLDPLAKDVIANLRAAARAVAAAAR